MSSTEEYIEELKSQATYGVESSGETLYTEFLIKEVISDTKKACTNEILSRAEEVGLNHLQKGFIAGCISKAEVK